MTGPAPRMIRFALVAAASLAAAVPAYQSALLASLRVASPEAALARSPGDSLALAKKIDRRIKEEGRYDPNAEDNRAALRSLVSNPLSRSSLRIIGMNADFAGDAARAATAMALSDRVSRRDTMAQIWLLEKAAGRDDFDAFLRHSHAALSVKPELGSVLQPILVTAMKYPQTRAAIRPYLRSNANWTPAFLEQASSEAPPEELLDMTLPVARRLSDERYQGAMARIAYRLAADGRWDDAMRLASETWGDFDAQEFASPAPGESTKDERLGALAWSLTTRNGVSARTSQDGVLDISIDPLSRGVLATRTLRVAGGGRYAFTQRVKFSGGGERARISWSADCVTSADEPGERLWDQPIPSRAEATTYRSVLDVPANCNLLTLTLSGTGPESQPPSILTITQFEFSRSRD